MGKKGLLVLCGDRPIGGGGREGGREGEGWGLGCDEGLYGFHGEMVDVGEVGDLLERKIWVFVGGQGG